jgi:membrane protease YdiL (CAAX protease family)
MDEQAIAAKLAERPDLQAIVLAMTLAQAALVFAGFGVLAWFLRTRGWKDRRGLAGAPRTRIADGAALALGLLVAAGAVREALGGAARPPGGIGFSEIVTSIAAIAAIALALVLVVAGVEGDLRPLGLARGGPPGAARAGLAVYVGVAALFVPAQYLSHAAFQALEIPPVPNPANDVLLQDDLAAHVAVVGILAALVAPIAEEVLFRGFLFGALRRRLGFAAAALGSALLFALVHPAVDRLPIAILAVGLAFAYEKTGSLAAPIACHVANNAMGVGLLLAQRHVLRALG